MPVQSLEIWNFEFQFKNLNTGNWYNESFSKKIALTVILLYNLTSRLYLIF